MRACFVVCILAAGLVPVHAQSAQPSLPPLEDVLRRMSDYVAAYGANASMFVATEMYTQNFDFEVGGNGMRPRKLLSEFSIVKAGRGETWVGYRDVLEVDANRVVDQRDRLLRLLTQASADASQLRQIRDESARYNIGPISRNINVPTTAMFFFHPSTIGRFSFQRKGRRDVDGTATWELEFTETTRPTLIGKRNGDDVPCKGTVWVVPTDGTVVRTRIELRKFADEQSMATRDKSVAIVEVTYRPEEKAGVWLPLKMTESYEGPITTRIVPGSQGRVGRVSAVAEYSNFRRFETSAKIVEPK